MNRARLFLCSGVLLDPRLQEQYDPKAIVTLDALGSVPNVNVRFEDVSKILLKHLSDRLADLLEIASYVYAADTATSRGTGWHQDGSVESWDRKMTFHIPVRDLQFWNRDDVKSILTQVLGFLSDDAYSFTFSKLLTERSKQEYLQFADLDDWPFNGVERIIMFSGGLDSLAGAVETAAGGGKLVLVSHRSVTTMDKRQRELFEHLRVMYDARMIRIPVWINKAAKIGREYTQRTRSFLYASIGAIVAESMNSGGVRFFENGVVSMNLPVADEAIRARASRTTHPVTLELLSRFYSLVLDRKIIVDNPYLFKTKAEVISILGKCNAANLIAYTCSCAHSWFKSKTQWHCGTCSQCIDRRIAILSDGLQKYDPETDYASDVFSGPRKEGYERNMATNYARHALELHKMSESEMASVFNLELSRAVRSFADRSGTAKRLIDLHKTHGKSVTEVIAHQIEKNAVALMEGTVDVTSMLKLIVGGRHVESTWATFSNRAVELLERGIPVSCRTHQPKDELHLQEISDGILRARNDLLVREYPFMRWASSLTKPDWSHESLNLWVELKYVRDRKNIRSITEDIAADITKYGDNERRTLFVIYDPGRHIVDRDAFAEDIHKHPGMYVAFVS
jgi:REase_DpnII-MboI